MDRISNILVVIAIGLLALCAMPATASEAMSPLGFKIFCIKNPVQCRAGGPASTKMTEQTMDQLKRVNLAINGSIRPVNDKRGTDVWTLNASAGDCEDYAITKRAKLIAMGMPPSALRIGYGKTRGGEGHAVLIVRTNEGDFVLDNLTNAIRPLSQAGIRLIAMSGPNPKKWVNA